MDPAFPCVYVTPECLRVVAVADKGVVPPHGARHQIRVPDEVIGCDAQKPEALFADAERIGAAFGFLSLCDVQNFLVPMSGVDTDTQDEGKEADQEGHRYVQGPEFCRRVQIGQHE